MAPTLTANAWRALIADIQGDSATAEAFIRLSGDSNMFRFWISRHRFDECVPLVDRYQDDPVWADIVAYFRWIVQKDPIGARRSLLQHVDLESGDNEQITALTVFALLADDPEASAAAISRLGVIPKVDWEEEISAAVLGLFWALRKDGHIDESSAESIRQLFALGDHTNLFAFQELVTLAEALSPKMPKPHRKFVIDLAKAVYDPTLRTQLNVYEVWRKAAD